MPANFNFFKLILGMKIPTITNEALVFHKSIASHQDFLSHYNKYILPYVENFEQQRIKALNKVRFRSHLLIPITIVTLALFFKYLPWQAVNNLAGPLDDPTFLIISLIVCTFASIFARYPITQYQHTVQTKIYPNIFNFFGNFQYSANGEFPMQDVADFDILPYYDDQFLTNSVCGTYKEVDLYFTQAQFTKQVQVHNAGKPRTKTVLVFKGILLLFSVNKQFTGKTIIKTEKNTFAKLLDVISTSMSRVKLEDPVFEKKFEVYSTDQIEARYLLSTSFMERLLKLAALFDNANLQCSFCEKQLFIMIPSLKPYFNNNSVYEPANFVADINNIIDQTNIIFEIIKTLKLNATNKL